MHRQSMNLKQKYQSSQPTFELWGLRMLCRANVWESLSLLDMGDLDENARFSWLKPLRLEINWMIAVYENEKFLKTGRVSDGCFNTCHGRLCANDDDSSDDNDELDEVIPAAARMKYLHEKLDPLMSDLDDLLDIELKSSSPSTLGQFKKTVDKSEVVRKAFASPVPLSLFKTLQKLQDGLGDELSGLSSVLQENLSEIRSTFNLSKLETRLFAFLLSATLRDDDVEVIIRCFDFAKNTLELLSDLAAAALDADRDEIKACLDFQSNLVRSGLIRFTAGSGDDLGDKIAFLDNDKFHNLLSMRFPVEKLLASIVKEACDPELDKDAYEHLPVVERILVPYLRKAVAEKRSGTNILLYGMPGTGKTQLVRVVAKALGTRLYEVAVDDDETHRSAERLVLWKIASSFLSSTTNTLLAIDEAEDIFNTRSQFSFLMMDNAVARTNKGEINSLLENNPVPTFWITNSIQSIDPAMIRRFNLVIEVAAPDLRGRRKIVDQTFGNRLSFSAGERLVQTQHLAPAVLTQAAKVADAVGFGEGSIDEDDVLELINETLRAQGFESIPNQAVALPEVYDPSFVNSDLDLMQLAEGLCQAGGGRLCLYGPPGTGKSAYAAWLARKLGRPLMRKTVAELTSCWVGVTEKLIAKTFREAQRSNAVLLIDEADSFLRDRTLSRASWETTQVNEMLTQIESFSGYFIATTNLLDALDPASLRRFDLKAKFDFMTPGQSVALAQKHLESVGLSLDDEAAATLRQWGTLTPGDFAAVMRQSRFRALVSAADLVSRLAEELRVKGHSATQKIGFC